MCSECHCASISAAYAFGPHPEAPEPADEHQPERSGNAGAAYGDPHLSARLGHSDGIMAGRST